MSAYAIKLVYILAPPGGDSGGLQHKQRQHYPVSHVRRYLSTINIVSVPYKCFKNRARTEYQELLIETEQTLVSTVIEKSSSHDATMPTMFVFISAVFLYNRY